MTGGTGQVAPEWDSDVTPYVMPPFSGRNIVIFSDGTGQAGGIEVDEFRSNVYKLFRATRCGPDSTIDPDLQLAYYDPGLGSRLAGDDIKVPLVRKAYNAMSSATGLGITRNLVDCYVELMKMWRPGDRIFLFGFSRGAYTVRCFAGVLGLCGIPTTMPDGGPLVRDPDVLKSIAVEAVKRVYRHGSGAGDTDDKNLDDRAKRLKAQRVALGAQFREKYRSADGERSNVYPHFIGVWDTVAAIGLSSSLTPYIWTAAFGAVALAGLGAAWFLPAWSGTSLWFSWLTSSLAIGLAGVLLYYILRFKSASNVPGHSWWSTIHLTPLRMKFFDRNLSPYVRYARHAIAIDEMRKDFDRVPWANDGEPPNREREEGAYLKQLWFAGNHSDIGGSYPENESRLSDIALKWMTAEAQKCGLHVNADLLKIYGRHTGQQHDEMRVPVLTIFGLKLKWIGKQRRMVANATLHPSVYARFGVVKVLIYDVEKPYRPDILAKHVALRGPYYGFIEPVQTAEEGTAPGPVVARA